METLLKILPVRLTGSDGDGLRWVEVGILLYIEEGDEEERWGIFKLADSSVSMTGVRKQALFSSSRWYLPILRMKRQALVSSTAEPSYAGLARTHRQPLALWDAGKDVVPVV